MPGHTYPQQSACSASRNCSAYSVAEYVVMVPLSATDPNGDPLTFTATAQSLADLLTQRYHLPGIGQGLLANIGNPGQVVIQALTDLACLFSLDLPGGACDDCLGFRAAGVAAARASVWRPLGLCQAG